MFNGFNYPSLQVIIYRWLYIYYLEMMLMDAQLDEFLEFQKFFNKLGLEIVGSKQVNNEQIYLVKKKVKD